MSQDTQLSRFIQARPHLVWYVRDLVGLSEDSIVENTLNYGTWQDVQELIVLLGRERVERIFTKQCQGARSNYRPAIANYFHLYFSQYATH
ncbi:MAG: hypothetical protein E6Q53_02365 [Candidatus Moraniibacteriota bacterium]|nr:MAG: hypothetical protein E6Q53_02365 [Candidatus Moranbacteria bacterium]